MRQKRVIIAGRATERDRYGAQCNDKDCRGCLFQGACKAGRRQFFIAMTRNPKGNGRGGTSF